MSSRISKQIKLTDTEYKVFTDLSEKSEWPSAKQYLDSIIEQFIEHSKYQTNAVISFLAPSKLGRYRTVWISIYIGAAIEEFASLHNVSQNCVLFTAVKQHLALMER